MKEFPNFYENIKEAQMRLRGTVVLYGDKPCYVVAITNHKPDGIFRIYLDPIGWDDEKPHPRPVVENFTLEDPDLGPYIDGWMVSNPTSGLLRKQMSSPLFNKFRPYPLGMCNLGKKVYYLERQPNRKTEQGLIRSMVTETYITAGKQDDLTKKIYGSNGTSVSLFSEAFRDCVLGQHPSPQATLANLLDSSVDNEAVAFHREFALVRGPADMLFLAYRGDCVGVLANDDFSVVRLGREFKHTKEVIADLHLFNEII